MRMLELTEIPDEKVDQLYSAIEVHSIEAAALTRKLRDLGKLPDKTLENTLVKLKRFDSLGPDEQRAIADFEKEYDMENPKDEQLPLSRVVDIVIHSYILQAIGGEGCSFTYLLVTSDHTRFTGLYVIAFRDFTDACNLVANKYPSALRAVYDHQAQKWQHTRT